MGGADDGSYRFVFAINGTRGDFQPYLSLGKHLVSCGHQVKFFTTAGHCKDAAAFGVDAMCVGGDVEAGLQNDNAMRAMEAGDFAKMLVSGLKGEGEEDEGPELVDGKTIEELQDEAYESFVAMKPHAYIANGLCFVAKVEQLLDEDKSIAKVHIGLQPQGGPPSNSFKHLMWAREFPEPDTPWICTHLWIMQSQARQQHQLMQGMAFTGQMPEELWEKFPGAETVFRNTVEVEKGVEQKIMCYSPSVFPPPPDWPDCVSQGSRIRVVGRMQFSREQQGEFSKSGNTFFSVGAGHEDCEAFLSKGTPPVYIGWGSMTVYGSEHMTYLAVEALKLAGQRGIILSGWGKLSEDDLKAERPASLAKGERKYSIPDREELAAWAAENVLFMKKAPHEWLFPQCCCCVHHGGIGTMQASLGAGTPTIITPVFADQESNAQFLKQGGWGEFTTRLGLLKPKELGEAIRKVCSEPQYKEKTQALYEKMQKEDGIRESAEILERLVREEVLTGKSAEIHEQRRVELREIRAKQVSMPIETIMAKWNAELNKRYPEWKDYNRRSMMFQATCKDALDDGRLWCVMGTSCLAREGSDLKSAEVGKFKKNCFLEQLEKKGSRIRVKNLKGYGPAEGWVSPTVSGKDILESIKDMGRISAIQAEMYNTLFEDLLQGDTVKM
eukprot:CAMPEP_0171191618 /NCGR_PEP_ID=MMETSP0790-20130122/19455_1 /TAXON_ID=2925 /ORGANISM="Alexandrium catenella, Strain OF101" /LENGTH=667 /DNA_ID=CAMNT_0011656767 /DNA_START=50 /DNA_END=2053 /DNA_ORIENTATION=+